MDAASAKVVVPVVVLVGSLVALVLFAPSCDGFEDDVVRMANACSLASDVLGGPVERRTWGYQPGSTSGRGRQRFSKQDVLVEGARARGTIAVDAMKHHDIWTVRTAVLRASGKEIELTRCGTHTTARLFEPRTFRGSVTAATGAPPAAPGEPCEMSIESRNSGELCRATLSCAGKPVYGATAELGFHLCGYVATGPSTKALVAIDTDRRLARDEPTLHFDERTGVARLQAKDSPSTWTLALTLRP